ncbi:patatin-like phospholipase family protein [Hoylesella shahii]|uniref:patatin-like phospholipase family protein n=1 Tax=Hoylesella shahii TaxID=228603 RepID=UPI001CB19FA9|nr:patatin-like phospholipase family protein [Hoylesella shahii]MBF1577304.1 patatin-like phospholipase family protein [Hoylesella shahii]
MKKNVALVLSSGGARGLAHIGAIEELERRGYCITSIAGCSMGALIGAMYAAGKLAEVKEWMVQLDKKKILSLVDFSFSLNHLVKGEKVMDALKEIVPDVNIEDLPIPYAAVATDWNSGKEVVFKKGSLYEAVRSSISIPLFFNPVRKGEMLLVDGGLVNGLPLNRVARVKGDLLVGVNVSTHDYKEEKLMSDIIDKKTLAKSLPAAIVKRIMDYQEGLGLNYMTLLSRTISIMLEQNTRQQIIISKPDIAVQVQMKRYGGNDYDKAAEISLIGEHKMRKALNEYEQAHASIWDQLKSFGK